MPNPVARRRSGGLVYPNLGAQFASASSQSLSAADSATLSMADIDFSCAMWVQLTTKSATMAVVSKGSFSGPIEYGVAYAVGSDRYVFDVSDSGNLHFTTATANTFGSPATGTWHFVVGSHDSVNDVLSISVNAGTADTTAYTFGSYDGAVAFRIGSDGGRFLNGLADSVAVWKKVLTSAEISRLYNGGVGMAYRDLTGSLLTSLVGWWDLDGLLIDASGNANTLTNNGGVTFVAGKR